MGQVAREKKLGHADGNKDGEQRSARARPQVAQGHSRQVTRCMLATGPSGAGRRTPARRTAAKLNWDPDRPGGMRPTAPANHPSPARLVGLRHRRRREWPATR